MHSKPQLLALPVTALLLLVAQPAQANPSPARGQAAEAWPVDSNFDLERGFERSHDSHPANSPASAAANPGSVSWETSHNGLSAKEVLGPHWTYQVKGSGPVVEFAALGAGRKERPGLMHVALGWNF